MYCTCLIIHTLQDMPCKLTPFLSRHLPWAGFKLVRVGQAMHVQLLGSSLPMANGS